MPRKRRWSLQQLEVEFSAIIAKVKLLFKKEGVSVSVPRRKRAKVNQIVQTELTRINMQMEKSNVIADTVIEIVGKERKKAIRQGDYEGAIVASVIEHFTNELFKKKKIADDHRPANTEK